MTILKSNKCNPALHHKVNEVILSYIDSNSNFFKIFSSCYYRKSLDRKGSVTWVKVFKNGPSEICGRQPLNNLKCLYHFKYFKSCLPQLLLAFYLNTWTHISISFLKPRSKQSFANPSIYLSQDVGWSESNHIGKFKLLVTWPDWKKLPLIFFPNFSVSVPKIGKTENFWKLLTLLFFGI